MSSSQIIGNTYRPLDRRDGPRRWHPAHNRATQPGATSASSEASHARVYTDVVKPAPFVVAVLPATQIDRSSLAQGKSDSVTGAPIKLNRYQPWADLVTTYSTTLSRL